MLGKGLTVIFVGKTWSIIGNFRNDFAVYVKTLICPPAHSMVEHYIRREVTDRTGVYYCANEIHSTVTVYVRRFYAW